MTIKISKRTVINNPKGKIIKLISKKDIYYKKFGELYLTNIKYNKIKAWKIHHKMTCNIFVITGKVEFVILIDRKSNKFKKFILSANGKNHINIPPGFIFGFKGNSKQTSSLLNLSDILHDDNEVTSFPINFFDYKWNKVII